jgi:hypothetical protein
MHYAALFASCLSVATALIPIQVLASTDETPGGFKFGETYISIIAGKKGMCQIELTKPGENTKQLECLAFLANKRKNVVSYTFANPGKADSWFHFHIYPKEKVGVVYLESGNTEVKRTISLDKLECYGDRGLKSIDGKFYAVRFHVCRADAPDINVKGTFYLER